MQNTGKYLLKSQRHAVVVALLLSVASLFIIPLFVAVATIVALITLMRGVKEGATVLFWALLPFVAFGVSQQVDISVAIVLFSFVLTYVLAVVLARFGSWTLTLEAAVISGLIFVMVLSIGFQEIQQILATNVATMLRSRQTDLTPDQLKIVLTLMTHLVLGYVVLQVLVIDLVALLLARGWQSRMVRPGMLAKEFNQLRAGKVMSAMVLLVIIGAILQVDLAMRCLPVIVLPYLFSAFAIVHSLLQENPNKLMFLIGFYFMVFMLNTIMLPLLVLLGFVDSWFDLRRWLRVR